MSFSILSHETGVWIVKVQCHHSILKPYRRTVNRNMFMYSQLEQKM